MEGRVVLRLILKKNAFGGSVQILILAAPQRPDKRDKPQTAQEQRYWNEEEKIVHDAMAGVPATILSRRRALAGVPPEPASRRMALPMTISDERDMAIAATSGVT